MVNCVILVLLLLFVPHLMSDSLIFGGDLAVELLDSY